MSRRAPKDNPDPRERILAVASDIFAAEGFAGARVDVIAAKAHINKAMLYYYYGDKEGLYAAVLLQTISRALDLLHSAVASASTVEERFRAVVSTIAGMARENPHFAPMLLREIASGGATLPDRVLAEMRRVFQVLADVLAEGAATDTFREVDPITTHMFIAGSLLILTAGAPIRRRVRALDGRVSSITDPTPTEIASYVSNLLLEGLCPRKPSPKRKRAGKAKKEL